MKLPIIHSPQELAELINQIGFLPFFANPVERFSLEDIVTPQYWFPDFANYRRDRTGREYGWGHRPL